MHHGQGRSDGASPPRDPAPGTPEMRGVWSWRLPRIAAPPATSAPVTITSTILLAPFLDSPSAEETSADLHRSPPPERCRFRGSVGRHLSSPHARPDSRSFRAFRGPSCPRSPACRPMRHEDSARPTRAQLPSWAPEIARLSSAARNSKFPPPVRMVFSASNTSISPAW